VTGLLHVPVRLRAVNGTDEVFEGDFLVDTGATDCLAPSSALHRIHVQPVGKMAYEHADGSIHEYRFGLVQIEFMGEVTAGRVIFGPDDAEPLRGVTALESGASPSIPRARR
jgi:clan AA aspartic protease